MLVVEDDDGNRLLVRRVLEEQGYAVVAVADGPSALRAITELSFDLVVLDLGLPGLGGLEVLAAIRRESGLPVLLLTARTAEHERVQGLDAGADDYMVKPYSLAELAARARALLRRGAAPSRVDRIELGAVALDLATATACFDGIALDLTPKEFALVEFLAASAGRTFSREAILHHVWGSTSDWQDPSTVTEHVRRIRMKLEAAGCDQTLIHTVRGFGYRATTDVLAMAQ